MKKKHSNKTIIYKHRNIIFALALIISLSFSGCKIFSPIFSEVDNVLIQHERPHVFAIFMDGTNNKFNPKKQNKNSNVKRMYDLRKSEYSSIYIEGVGTNLKGGGMLFGIGTKARVVKAYIYLSERYTNSNDSIFLIGFSRGAYSCRILSNLIYTAGILDLKKITGIQGEKTKKKLINGLYDAYAIDNTISMRKKTIASYINKWNKDFDLNLNDEIPIDTSSTIKIESMALFETVEAHGWYNHKEDFESPNKKHFNQLNNIIKAYHAMSLDDNRALIYTPILLTTQEVANSLSWGTDSVRELKEVIEEVWFSGAHSDIGGSLEDTPMISYTSLKWMLSRFEKYSLFKNTSIKVNEFAEIRNMHRSIFKYGTACVNRNIPLYYNKTKHVYKAKLNIHESVIHRLEKGYIPEWKVVSRKKARRRNSWAKFPLAKDSKWETEDWFQKKPFIDCFEIIESNDTTYYFLKEKHDSINVVKDTPQ